jgi:hypothetical protein
MTVYRSGALKLHEIDANDIETALSEVGVLRNIDLDAIDLRGVAMPTIGPAALRVATCKMTFAGGRFKHANEVAVFELFPSALDKRLGCWVKLKVQMFFSIHS